MNARNESAIFKCKDCKYHSTEYLTGIGPNNTACYSKAHCKVTEQSFDQDDNTKEFPTWCPLPGFAK